VDGDTQRGEGSSEEIANIAGKTGKVFFAGDGVT